MSKKHIIERRCNEIGVSLPPEGERHYLSHLNEMSTEAIEDGFRCLKKYGRTILSGYNGVHTFNLSLEGIHLKTRLTGPKMGHDSLEFETRSLKDRGEGRGYQSCVVRTQPFTATNLLTFVIFDDKLLTLYAGPEMPPIEHDPDGEWVHHALAFRQDEL